MVYFLFAMYIAMANGVIVPTAVQAWAWIAFALLVVVSFAKAWCDRRESSQ